MASLGMVENFNMTRMKVGSSLLIHSVRIASMSNARKYLYRELHKAFLHIDG